MLRQFLYLDRELVREFLAQIERGVYDESRERSNQSRSSGLHGRVGVGPAGAGGERGKSANAESEAVVKQTAASEFDRLYESLEQAGLQIYEVIDEKLEELPIKRKDIIEVDARLRVSGLQTMLDLIGTFSQIMPLMEQLGSTAEIDPQTLQGMQALSALDSDDRPLPLIATVPGETALQIALDLTQAGVFTTSWDGEATVLCKVQRLLRRGDRHVVGDPFGGLMKIMPEGDRRKILESLRSDSSAALGIGEAEVAYPGLIGTPIAIYR